MLAKMTELGEILDLLAVRGPTSPSHIVQLLGDERRPEVVDALKILALKKLIAVDRPSGLVRQLSSLPAMT